MYHFKLFLEIIANINNGNKKRLECGILNNVTILLLIDKGGKKGVLLVFGRYILLKEAQGVEEGLNVEIPPLSIPLFLRVLHCPAGMRKMIFIAIIL